MVQKNFNICLVVSAVAFKKKTPDCLVSNCGEEYKGKNVCPLEGGLRVFSVGFLDSTCVSLLLLSLPKKDPSMSVTLGAALRFPLRLSLSKDGLQTGRGGREMLSPCVLLVSSVWQLKRDGPAGP